MHSFLYSRRAGGPHISALFYTCNMQKRENKAIFLRISGETAKNEGICSRQQNATGVCRASCPANTPARLAAWTVPQNYVLLFSQTCRQYSHAKHSAAAGKLTSGVSRPIPSRHYFLFFYTSNLSLPSANPIPSGSPGQHTPPPHLSIPGLTAFHKPAHSNSRQVSPAGCQYILLPPHSFFFFSPFSFSLFFLSLTPSFSPSHNQKSCSFYTLSATPAVLFFSALCCLYFYIFRPGNRQSAAARRAAGLKNLVS